jgi:hypothetical protein
MSDVRQQQAAILLEHLGTAVPVDGGAPVTVRPLSMEDLLDAQVIADLAAVADLAMGSLDRLTALLKGTPEGTPDVQALLALFTPALPAVKRCLARCIDRPLAQVPAWAVPAVMEAFVQQNFTAPRLKPWADLAKAVAKRTQKTPGSSPTPSTCS